MNRLAASFLAALLIGGVGLLLLSMCATSAAAADWRNPNPQETVWQYSVPVGKDIDHRAYLWIPQGCRHVRGVLIGDQNMLEEPMFEDPTIRKACSDSGLGIVWFAPGDDIGDHLYQHFDPGAAAGVQQALADLAGESGYSEIENAPLLAAAHSASTPFVWGMADAFASRMFALLPYKGWFTAHMTPNIPTMHVSSEYAEVGGVDWGETNTSDRQQIARLRSDSPSDLMGESLDVGDGHYEWDPNFAPVLAMFIEKAAQYRLPADGPLTGPVTLKPIDPTTGWLIDPDRLGTQDGALVSYAQYKGDPTKAFWYFDKEMADTVNDYIVARMAKKPQVIDFVDRNGQPEPLVNGGVAGIDIVWQPDNVSFKVAAVYLDKSPTTRLYNGDAVGHSDAPILFKVSSGGIEQTGPDTFRMWMKRGSLIRQGAPWEPTIMAYTDGDAEYRRADRPGHPWLKLVNTDGAPQTIAFPTPGDVKAGTKSITLHATASSGLPVQFFVVSGPVELSDGDNSKLDFLPIPPRTRFPMRVIVGAYQWGRTTGDKIQNAMPVYDTFTIDRAKK